MKLENNYNIVMNHKRIRMLMKKYSLITKVRRAKSYANMLRANHEHKTLPSLLKKILNKIRFKKYYSQILLIYITVMLKEPIFQLSKMFHQGRLLLITLHKDSMSIVLKALDRLEYKLNLKENSDTIIHSDQGFHYTNDDFQSCVKKIRTDRINVNKR